ncbi:MAG: SDR family oxidoreductase [Gaiellales bacterium]
MNLATLEGRVAWVTGGASGMGRATALRLAEHGVNVAIGSLVESQREVALPDQNVHTPPDTELLATVALLEERGIQALGTPLDVCSPDSIQTAYRAVVRSLGPVDILVNAAGTSARMPLLGHPDEIWLRLIETNLTGTFRTIRACLPSMIERGYGRIVNIASTAAHVGYPLHAAYCASKSGLLGLARSVATECRRFNITCNTVSPGWVATESNFSACEQEIEIAGLGITVEEYRARIAAEIPQRRFLSPDEVGALVVFLCGEGAGAIDSSDITIAMGSQW